MLRGWILALSLWGVALGMSPGWAAPGKRVAMTLEKADALAAVARREKDAAQKTKAMRAALAAYDELLAQKPKDRKQVPRLRRKRASLLRACGLLQEAVEEHDKIVAGPARRKDKARAWREGGALLLRNKNPVAAERYMRCAIEEFGDIIAERARALLALGSLLAARGETKEAERAWRAILKRCRDETKTVVAAYDRLALLAIAKGDKKRARRWLRECVQVFEKQAARDDRRGRYVARLLGEMKAPGALHTTAPG